MTSFSSFWFGETERYTKRHLPATPSLSTHRDIYAHPHPKVHSRILLLSRLIRPNARSPFHLGISLPLQPPKVQTRIILLNLPFHRRLIRPNTSRSHLGITLSHLIRPTARSRSHLGVSFHPPVHRLIRPNTRSRSHLGLHLWLHFIFWVL
jgi:hypothetical protein